MALKAGNKLSSSLSELISFFTETEDLREVANEADKSVELLRAILRRDRDLTENNIPMIHSILKKAIAKKQVLMPKLNSSNRKAKAIIDQLGEKELQKAQ